MSCFGPDPDPATPLNFGAFLGFTGVNLSMSWSYYLKPPSWLTIGAMNM
jgi:hypothetical protein